MSDPDGLPKMQQVHQTFDPAVLANPGQVFVYPRSCGASVRLGASIAFEQPEMTAVEVY